MLMLEAVSMSMASVVRNLKWELVFTGICAHSADADLLDLDVNALIFGFYGH